MDPKDLAEAFWQRCDRADSYVKGIAAAMPAISAMAAAGDAQWEELGMLTHLCEALAAALGDAAALAAMAKASGPDAS